MVHSKLASFAECKDELLLGLARCLVAYFLGCWALLSMAPCAAGGGRTAHHIAGQCGTGHHAAGESALNSPREGVCAGQFPLGSAC